jgi:glutamate 5-kinase
VVSSSQEKFAKKHVFSIVSDNVFSIAELRVIRGSGSNYGCPKLPVLAIVPPFLRAAQAIATSLACRQRAGLWVLVRPQLSRRNLLEVMMSLIAFLPSPPTPIRTLQPPSSEPLSPAVSQSPPSSDSLRQQVAAAAHTLVVKVGTRVLTQADGTLNHARIEQLAEEIQAISHSGRRVVLVSSGAVGAGISLLGLKTRPTDLAKLQAVAAVGQTHLIQAYDRTFAKHGKRAAQVLLTIEDVDDRIRYLNVRNTLNSLLEFGAIPIINENDTVSVDELKTTFGDNDRLAAMVTNLLRAPLLIVLSDIQGLFNGDPSLASSKLVPTVEKIDERVLGYVRDRKTGLSKGGMASKLDAARIVTTAGENMIIATGRESDVLTRIMAGENVGTLFLGQAKGISPFKRWLGFSAQVKGRIQLDEGARVAIVEKGRSLLAAGIVGTQGEFQKGDVVALCDGEGKVVARGLTNYSSADVERIKGIKSEKIAQVLGRRPYEEVIHRDNLAVVK